MSMEVNRCALYQIRGNSQEQVKQVLSFSSSITEALPAKKDQFWTRKFCFFNLCESIRCKCHLRCTQDTVVFPLMSSLNFVYGFWLILMFEFGVWNDKLWWLCNNIILRCHTLTFILKSVFWVNISHDRTWTKVAQTNHEAFEKHANKRTVFLMVFRSHLGSKVYENSSSFYWICRKLVCVGRKWSCVKWFPRLPSGKGLSDDAG